MITVWDGIFVKAKYAFFTFTQNFMLALGQSKKVLLLSKSLANTTRQHKQKILFGYCLDYKWAE